MLRRQLLIDRFQHVLIEHDPDAAVLLKENIDADMADDASAELKATIKKKVASCASLASLASLLLCWRSWLSAEAFSATPALTNMPPRALRASQPTCRLALCVPRNWRAASPSAHLATDVPCRLRS